MGSIVDPALRLSAQRALLGAIYPNFRAIKVTANGSQIVLTVICEAAPDETEIDAVSAAAAEIVADFPHASISEQVIVINGPLPVEDALVAGWVFQRAE
ncbi:hypothetical protein [Phenylobacterium montanum]|uniref:Uncharacterized protein n=1 Tax=Phenylobacterium montanum TaxID=2823693 RepID=A0A975IU12_9CAUL|nr:hypothetical protein [Caulobacter sp. S6]QUD87044.1 hypothetical protein KCG34_18515 [Caulobacter sp. S6]